MITKIWLQSKVYVDYGSWMDIGDMAQRRMMDKVNSPSRMQYTALKNKHA